MKECIKQLAFALLVTTAGDTCATLEIESQVKSVQGDITQDEKMALHDIWDHIHEGRTEGLNVYLGLGSERIHKMRGIIKLALIEAGYLDEKITISDKVLEDPKKITEKEIVKAYTDYIAKAPIEIREAATRAENPVVAKKKRKGISYYMPKTRPVEESDTDVAIPTGTVSTSEVVGVRTLNEATMRQLRYVCRYVQDYQKALAQGNESKQKDIAEATAKYFKSGTEATNKLRNDIKAALIDMGYLREDGGLVVPGLKIQHRGELVTEDEIIKTYAFFYDIER